MSPSTQDSPKVPEKPWPKMLYARKEADWICEPRLSIFSGVAANEPDLEEETYIPVSALLSDEAVESSARVFATDRLGKAWASLDEEHRANILRQHRKYIISAIEQVGGAK